MQDPSSSRSSSRSGGSHVAWIVALVAGIAIGIVGDRFLGPKLFPPPKAPPAPNRLAENRKPPAPPRVDTTVYKIPVDDSPAKGPAEALVTIVESSDFECPFCKRVVPTVHEIEKAYAGKVRLVFKQNPLPMHKNAMMAAEATMEALAQGGPDKFWAMHDKLFALSPLDRAGVEKAAGEIGLDTAKFTQALDAHAHVERIQRDQKLVQSLGAGGTPAFFINGRLLSGAQPFSSFKTVIDEELAKAEKLVSSGTPAKDLYAKIIENGATTPKTPPQKASRPQEDPKAVYKVPLEDSPVKGPANALVTIVESSDFECPFCKRVIPTVQEIEKTYKGKVRLVFKQNPLPMHKNAMMAAEATMEALAQGGPDKFWAMHDKLFAMTPLDRAGVEKAAGELGLDVAGLTKALDTHTHKDRIVRDQKLVQSLGAGGTPAFFINGRKLSGARPFADFKAVIDEELAKAEKLVSSGTPASKVYEKIIANGATAPVMMAALGRDVKLRPDDPARGASKAKVTLVLFSDFECPFCSRIEPGLAQALSTYKDSLRVIWKHKPLPMHKNAIPAAEAAEAAREQGKFWEMHDLMIQHQKELTPANFEAWAGKLGLNAAKFKEALDSHRFQARIKEDEQIAGSLGVTGTPTFFVNCLESVGAMPFEQLKPIIEKEIAKADALIKQGVALDDKFYERACKENMKPQPPTAAAQR